MEPDNQENSGRDEKGRFVKGSSGNPEGTNAGRPKISIVAILREKLAEVPEGEKRTRAEIMVAQYLDDAIANRDGVAIRDIIDRIDGKPMQPMEHSGELEGRLIIVSENADRFLKVVNG